MGDQDASENEAEMTVLHDSLRVCPRRMLMGRRGPIGAGLPEKGQQAWQPTGSWDQRGESGRN